MTSNAINPNKSDTLKKASQSAVRISTFDIDATPPVGYQLAYDPMAGSWDLGLRAKGIVLFGYGKPVVLCAIDWLGIANKSQDVFKKSIADAVNTDMDRVMIHTLHQHDAPVCDFSAEKILKQKGIKPQCFDGTFPRRFLKKLKTAIKNSVKLAQPVTHYSIGKAPVYKVASNRRIIGENGKVTGIRYSSCKDSLLRAKPEGTIDSMVNVIGFWNEKSPIAILSFYACHPQSYYLTKTANPDFPGLARFYRQLEVPDAMHVHFNGAGGNITAGKYNDGSHEQRAVLAQRLAGGMKRAWETGTAYPLRADDLVWSAEPVSFQPADSVKLIESRIKTEGSRYISNNATKLAWMKRTMKGKKINISCLQIGSARILFMPGELFVEYQLAAKAMRPDLFVTMAAYGDYGPSYIGTKESYNQGGYEIEVSPVNWNAESTIMSAMKKLLSF